MSFDWQNAEGIWTGQEQQDAARRQEDAARGILHQFATEQTVGYADAQKYGSGFASTDAGVEIRDSAWEGSIRTCDAYSVSAY